MKVLLILLLFVVQTTNATASCDNNECKECQAAEGCSFAVQFDGKGSCVREEDLEKLILKKVVFTEEDCITFYKGKKDSYKVINAMPTDGRKDDGGQGHSKLPRSTGIKSVDQHGRPHVNLTRPVITAGVRKPNYTSVPTIFERQLVSSPVTIRKRGNLTVPISEPTKSPSSLNSTIGYNCNNYRGDNDNERLTRILCRTYELIVKKGKLTPLDTDLIVMNLLNPMRMKIDECKMLRWRKVKCTNTRI